MRLNAWIALLIVGVILFFSLLVGMLTAYTIVSTPDGNTLLSSTSQTLALEEGANITITGNPLNNTVTISATGSAVTGSGVSNAFAIVDAPNGSDPSASGEDTLTLAQGSNITITGDSGTNTITIAATGSSISNAFADVTVDSGTNPAASGEDTLVLTGGQNIETIGSASNTVTVGVTGTVVSGYAAFTDAFSPEYVTPGWGCDGMAARAYTVFTNDLLAYPILVAETTTYTSIGTQVTAASTVGTTMRLGIYEANYSQTAYGWVPGNLLLDAGTVSVGSTGFKSIAINQTLQGSTVYFIAVVTDSSASLTLNTCDTGGAAWTHFQTMTGNSANPPSNSGFRVDTVGTGALPDPFPTPYDDGTAFPSATSFKLGFG